MFTQNTGTWMFKTVLFMVTKCPLTDEWINKMWCVYTMRYYLAIKRNVVLIPAITRMDLENLMLSEINHSKNTKYCMISFR